MAKKKLCIICHAREAAVPDRCAQPGRLTLRVCSECHSKRLRGDMAKVLKQAAQQGTATDRRQPRVVKQGD
jgi:hypothetical protein